MGELDTYIPMLILNSIAIVCNAITVIVIIASKTLRKTQNIFLWNIAFSDFVATFMTVFTLLYRHFTREYISDQTGVLIRVSYLTGICSTVSVALHRIFVIRFDPFNTRKLFTGPRCIFVCIIFWAVLLTFSFAIQAFARQTYFAVSAILPLATFGAHCLSAVCYAVVYMTISGAARKAGLSGDTLEQRVKQNKKVLMTFALVVGTNILCWTPFCVRLIIGYVRPEWIVPVSYPYPDPTLWFIRLENAALCFQGVNGILNPLIYFTRLTGFRQLLRDTCFRNRQTTENGDISSSKAQTKETTVENGEKI
ncbi:uncharacterized protein LOC129273115 [Lytechinus pictus]|uniref:uncharacterized protein LOC129273115 n=1 Tax=Lytechinus pictus TaxID=7653 RepID=UPI0030BA194D